MYHDNVGSFPRGITSRSMNDALCNTGSRMLTLHTKLLTKEIKDFRARVTAIGSGRRYPTNDISDASYGW